MGFRVRVQGLGVLGSGFLVSGYKWWFVGFRARVSSFEV